MPLTSTNDMVSCHRVVELLLDYLDGELDEKIAVAMDQHFEMCPECVAFTAQYRNASELCRKELVRETPPEITEHVLEFLRKELG